MFVSQLIFSSERHLFPNFFFLLTTIIEVDHVIIFRTQIPGSTLLLTFCNYSDIFIRMLIWNDNKLRVSEDLILFCNQKHFV